MKPFAMIFVFILIGGQGIGFLGKTRAATVTNQAGKLKDAPTAIRYVAPTANLTLIANAIQYRSKSLTTLGVIPAGLKVSGVVQVSIGYYSAAGNGRVTQNYVTATGNRFLYYDKEGDGKPRAMRVDVSLLEVNPNGAPFTFSFSSNVNLDPLYDVQISPLRFTLLKDCASFGDSDIGFYWYTPDITQSGNTRNFSTSANKLVVINEFAWVGREISAAIDRRQPVAWFSHRAPSFFTFQRLGHNVSEAKLVPGKTKKLQYLLDETRETTLPGCFANAEYTMNYTLRSYPYLF